MVGYLGDHALAAVGISGFLFFWGSSIYFGVNEAIQVYVARYFGVQNKQFQDIPLVIGILSVLVLGAGISEDIVK
ncbi:MAG: MATE family efflux transporter [bacterium]